jgi:UDP-glucose 4-epimerase
MGGTELADHPNMTFVRRRPDAELIAKTAKGATHIVHLAHRRLTRCWRPWTMRVNLIGTYNVLEAAQANTGTVERLVDFSTSEVFGRHAYKVEEIHETAQGSVGEARWTYAVSKLAGEHLAHSYHDEFGLPTVSVRPFNVYGPGQIGGGAIRAFIETALAGEDLVIHGDGSQIRAWCYVDDMVDGLMLVLERPEAVGQVFNIGNSRSVVTPTCRPDQAADGGRRRHHPRRCTTPTSRCGSRTSTRPASSSAGTEGRPRRGLARTIAWYRERQPAPA